MVNSSHSGTDIEKIKKEFEILKLGTFPESPENDQLYDIYSELVELDGHIAGLVSSVINGNKIKKELLSLDDTFNEMIESTHPSEAESKKTLETYRDRKFKLDSLIMLIKDCKDLLY